MSARLRLALVVLGVAAVAVLALVTISHSPARVRHFVDEAGGWAPPVFILVSAALSCAFFPGQLLAAASGLLFGTALGTPLTITAATLAAVTAFSITRHGGRSAFDELSGARIEAWQERIERGGFMAVLYARIAPLMPFVAINYVAGLTRLRLRDFTAATVIGIAPRAFAYTALGGHLDNLDSPQAIAAVAVLLIMAVGGAYFFLRGRRARRSASPRAAAPGTGSSSPAGRSAARP
ncbi:MAG: hypothetical protein QOK04_2176 [Solirubrobacteraceae bacterium]|nr:hypothetical protein [Solirubrobacteraceae bacterium]